ncbi:2506_t:CDS:1 [Ambispora gerdemannii]|uniref:2506_t:CDS:1 n=1 Tax=Ambispora gerdemannii TaxID=144530 RepID=A0A9N8Z2B6_9GLOM|nr:2506_t:CDS:1 [Ambispora gerdemannii]
MPNYASKTSNTTRKSYSYSRHDGPLNGLAKQFIEQINKGTKYSQIQRSICDYLEEQNLELAEILERIENGYRGHEYRKQFRVLNGFFHEKFRECYDPRKAFAEYKAAAETNYSYGYLFVGICYENGSGVRKNPKRAFEYYQKSVEYSTDNNFACGQYRLARCYERGVGTPVDIKLAFHWFKKAIIAGNLGALNNIGCWYEKGEYVKKDLSEAYKHYYQAAKEGLPCAQFNTAEFLRRGCGTKKDDARAFHWYQKAAANGESGAQFWLAQYYRKEGANQSNRLALKWYLEAAKAIEVTDEIIQTYYNLALIYDYGQLGTVRDNKKAFEWYQKASDAGVDEATKRLAECYRHGLGTEIDLDKANKLAVIGKESDTNNDRKSLSFSLSPSKIL